MMKKKKSLDDDVVESKTTLSQWEMFVKAVIAHVDPVLASILLVTEFQDFNSTTKIVRVATLKKFVLFQDLFIEQKKIYQQYLDRIFGFQTMLIVEFNKIADIKLSEKRVSNAIDEKSSSTSRHTATKNVKFEKQKSLDVSDTSKWKMTHALLEHFGGTVKEIVKDTHEFDA